MIFLIYGLTPKKKSRNNVKLTDDYRSYWAYIPHFIHTPFYVYAYAFGDCLVNSLYSRFERYPNDFNDKYFNLLESGGSKNYRDFIK